MPQGNLVEVLRREVRQGSPAQLMVASSPLRQRRQPCNTNKGMPDEAADAAALTYLLTWELYISPLRVPCIPLSHGHIAWFRQAAYKGVLGHKWVQKTHVFIVRKR